MEQLIRELIQSVDNLNKFSWSDLISLVSLIGAWITIFFLIKDKIENKRPYFYDFVIPELKLCVEYNGVKFHPREGDVEWVGLFGETYEYKLNYDKRKIKVIEDCGYNVIVVWEDDNLDKKIKDIVSLFFCYI